MKIKICGITNTKDAQDAVSLGADAIGFIFSKSSPRSVTPEIVEEISLFLPPFVTLVGVFVNEEGDRLTEIVNQCQLDVVQLHGDESPTYCQNIPHRVIKAFRVSDVNDLTEIAKYQGMISAMLLDTKVKEIEGGTGQTFDWGLALKAQDYELPLILAGGITTENINKAVQLVNPYAIDLSSGVESEPGKKDYHKMSELISLAHRI